MKFAIIRNGSRSALRDQMVDQVTEVFLRNGYQLTNDADKLDFVLNLTDIDHPQIFRRKSQAIMVISVVEAPRNVANLRAYCYTTLVKSLSNMLVCIVSDDVAQSDDLDKYEIYFTTPEAGFFHTTFDPEKVFEKIIPIAGAHFMIRNEISADLPQRYWITSPVVEKIKNYGKVLDEMGVLPAPFPLKEVLSLGDIGNLYRLFEVKGLSYGNLSARENIAELDGYPFWMTARGVNKAQISMPGKDILLVKGYDLQANSIMVSVPPEHDPRVRVSVDAIEHALIYERFPGVGAIVHAHAWMEDVPCTFQNYPCGTIELAREVVLLLERTENPQQTAVGLKNHGLTITGKNLDEIFQRIRGKLLTEVPMFT